MRWLNVGLSAFIAWKAAMLLGLSLGGMVAVFVVCFVVLGLVGSGLTGGIWNSGLWTTLPIRRAVGLVGDGCAILALWWIGADITDRLDILGRVYRYALAHGEADNAALLAWMAWGWCALVLPLWLLSPLKVFVGRLFLPVARIVRSRFVGMGGSSTFGGLFNDWAHPWKPGQLILGGSMYSPGWKVGRSDDRHFITIATSRSGKGRSGIIPNLLTWPGSALVIDPKGQNAAVTAAARGRGGGRVKKGMGQTIRIVDPFGELKGQGVALPVHRFNPLAELKPEAPDIVEQINNIADALVVPDPHGTQFFDRSARNLIAGIIGTVMAHPAFDGKRSLISVRMMLRNIGQPPNEGEDDNYFRKIMREVADAFGGLPAGALSAIESGGENSTGDVLSTALSHTEWLDSVAMQDALGVSEFTLSELKASPTTLYLVLPPQYLDVHGRFLRLFVNLALLAVGQGRKPPHGVLFVLDEFYALGRLQLVAKAAGLLAGFGVKLWPIVQNLGQLQELYPDNWETFLGNAGMWQVFAVNDQTTARYMSERLGEHIVWRKIREFDQVKQKYIEEWTPQGASFLRTGIELGRETSRDSGNQVIFVEGADSFLLRRRPYDRTFKREEYSPDPSEPRASSLRGRLDDWYEGFQNRLDDKGREWSARLEQRFDAWEIEWQKRRAARLAAKQAGKDGAGQ